MSTINTNGISVTYPVPGVNNNSQGFRDNFTSIKTNLTAAGTEITDLQNKVIVKSALANTVVNNDMNGTLMSNTLTRTFRASTYNLGNDLTGDVTIDITLGDVQYGTIAGDITLNFTGWTTDGQNNVELQLAVANAAANVFFVSPNISPTACFGASSLENYNSEYNSVSIPNGVCQLDYRLSSIDCGGNITIEPVNRPRRISQVRTLTPNPVGNPGDTVGTVAVDTNIAIGITSIQNVQLQVTATYANNAMSTSTSSQAFYIGMPVVFTGATFGGITAETTYYVSAVVPYSSFAVSTTPGGANVALSATTGIMFANPVTYLYSCTQTYDPNQVTITQANVNLTSSPSSIRIDNLTSDFVVNAPIIFTTGVDFPIGGLWRDVMYYIKTISGYGTNQYITVSYTRNNGIAGPAVATLWNASGLTPVTTYIGPDIWKRIPLNAW